MKTNLLAAFLCILSLQTSISQWVQVSNGMGSISVISLAASGNNMFAGVIGLGVYISTNNGTDWIQTSLNNRTVHSLAVNANNIFAGTQSYGIYKSTNNGTNWTQTTLNDKIVYALAVSGNNIFAGTNTYGVYISTDNGANWTQTQLNNHTVWPLAVSGNRVFAGDVTFGAFVTTNNGANWTQTSLNNLSVWELAASGPNVFAGVGSYEGVYRSTNNGTTWNSTSLNNQEMYALTANGNNIFAGTVDSGIFVSNDNGASWTRRNEGLSAVWVNDFCILNNYIYCATHSFGVWRRPLSELVGIRPISNEIPGRFSLAQNYPNPFNPSTKIRFSLLKSADVRLVIFDVLGRKVAALVNEQLNSGTYEVDFDGSKLSSGVYYYTLVSAGYTLTRKMVLKK